MGVVDRDDGWRLPDWVGIDSAWLARGVPIGLAHDGANRHDAKLLSATFDSIPIRRPHASKRRPQGLCLDRGYDYPWVHEWVAEQGLDAHIRGRRDGWEAGAPCSRRRLGPGHPSQVERC